MPRNYDSSVPGTPYWRITSVAISYDQDQVATVDYTEQLSIVTTAGNIAHVAGPGTTRSDTFRVPPANYGNSYPLVTNPTTGATTGTTTHGMTMLHILSALRDRQTAYDALVDNPPPPPQD